jgi:hypothetical protein
MNTKLTLCAGAFALATLLLPTISTATVTTITFDNVPADVQCDEVWQEAGVDLYFTSTTAEDCDGGGNCFFGLDVGLVWLYPSRLVIDLGGSFAVTEVEVDWQDYCGVGCTRGFVYDGGSTVASAQNSVVGSVETVTLVPSSGQADRIALSSCEGQILEVRITMGVVSSEATTWSSVKALYE